MRPPDQIKWLCYALVFGALPAHVSSAAEPTVQVFTQNTVITTSSTTAGGRILPGIPATGGRLLPAGLQGSVSVTTGYDDNISTSQSAQGTGTTTAAANLSYSTRLGRARINVVGGGGITYYFSPVGGRDSDTNGFGLITVTYPVSLRLQLDGSVSARYQTEPQFDSGIGLDRRAGSYVVLDTRVGANYRWSLRLSSSASYSFRMIDYDSAAGAFQNRVEHSFGQGWSYRLSKRTTLTGNYQFEVVDYDQTPADSVTHTFLAGGSYRVTSRLTATASGGVSLRSLEGGTAKANPRFEGSLDYSLGPRGSVNWRGSYSVEEATIVGASSRTSAQTGLLLNYLLTWRLTAILGLNYRHDENEMATFGGLPGLAASASSQDAFEFSLALRCVINRRFSLDARYLHSEVMSDAQFLQYARNSFSLGLSMSF